jgi:hypothetical protein
MEGDSMRRLTCVTLLAGLLLAGMGFATAGAASKGGGRCGVEGADIVDGLAEYDQTTSTLTFRLTTGGASCTQIKYQISAYADDDPASPALATVTRSGDGVTTNPDLSDFVFFTFNDVPAGDLIFCFVGKRSGPLFERAPDTGRACFDTSGSGGGFRSFR